MKRIAPLDPSEPPGGDFVRYVEGLNTASAAQAAEQAAGHASRARAAQADTEGPATQPSAAQPSARRPAAWGPPSTLGRAAAWMIGAGIALVLLAVLSSGSAFIDTFLPGMLLIGAGLAFRKHFRKR